MSERKVRQTACLARSSSPLRSTTHSFELREISRSVKNSALMAAFRDGAQSLETARESTRLFPAPFSPVAKSRFPETETAVAETGSIVSLLSGEAEYLALA